MATVVLRPDSTTSEAGWNASNIHTTIGDDNAATGPTQNDQTCNFQGTLDDLDSGLSGATINSFTISATAVAGRAGSATCVLSLVHSSDGIFAAETETLSGSETTQTTSARTTQQDGSSALTFAYINNCSVKIVPSVDGITLKELFVTVDYDLDPSGFDSEQGTILLKAGKGKIRLTAGKIIF